MFWNLLLAHFLADYPLQSSWMVRNKKSAWVIGLHSAIQLAVMVALLYPLSLRVWPALGLVAGLHFFIDSGKTHLGAQRKQWVAVPYLFDQALHLAILGLVVLWAGPVNSDDLVIKPIWSIYITAGLVVTYVWFITERVLYHADVEYFREVLENFWGRMAARLALLGFSIAGVMGLAGIGVTLGIGWFTLYRSPIYRWRAILIDLVVALVGGLFIWLVTATHP